jgi:hypothetical protein
MIAYLHLVLRHLIQSVLLIPLLGMEAWSYRSRWLYQMWLTGAVVIVISFVKHIRRLHFNRSRPPPSPSSYMHSQHLLQSLNYSLRYMTSAVETASCEV